MALNSTERQIYDEYIRNRFEGAEESSLPGEDSLEIWEKIIDYGLFLGFDKAINAKICPDRPVEFEDPETINIRLYDTRFLKRYFLFCEVGKMYFRITENFALRSWKDVEYACYVKGYGYALPLTLKQAKKLEICDGEHDIEADDTVMGLLFRRMIENCDKGEHPSDWSAYSCRVIFPKKEKALEICTIQRSMRSSSRAIILTISA